jgi:hypothetical protein
VEREADWSSQADLLERHARACSHLSDPAASLHSWFLLCWQFPALGDRIETGEDHNLGEAWQDFLDLEPELPVEDFPAWLLLRVPATTQIAPDRAHKTPCPDSYPTLLHLQRSRQAQSAKSAQQKTLELRARLKQQAPLLFRYFLESLE